MLSRSDRGDVICNLLGHWSTARQLSELELLTGGGCLGKSTFRVLVVDDYEPWRSLVSKAVQEIPELELAGEAADGLEAIQIAEQLQPDLILLDIGLPTFNGFEVARRIRTLSPGSKIVFTTQESSDDMLEEALKIGASGYVVKAAAGRELIPAITAVLKDEQFLGSKFTKSDFTGSSSLRTTNTIRKTEIVYHHEAHFHSNDESLLDGITQCVRTSLSTDSAIIVFASESHWTNLNSRMEARGIDLTAAVGRRRCIPLDPIETLSKFMVGDLPDPIRLFNVLNDVIDTASGHSGAAHTRTVACGGLAPILLSQGKPEAAIRLEQLWNQVVQNYGLDTVCMYSQNSFESEQGKDVFQRICGLHSSVYSH